jgi:hypothetical protein
MLILCQSHHGVYACIPSRATASGSDGMCSSTWVHAIRSAWAPTAMSHHARCLRPHLPKASGLVALICCGKPLDVFDRRLGQTSGEIIHVRSYRRVEKWRRDLLLRLVLFGLVAPPLQPGVVGPYPVHGVWFSSRLPLEGTNRIQNFGL